MLALKLVEAFASEIEGLEAPAIPITRGHVLRRFRDFMLVSRSVIDDPTVDDEATIDDLKPQLRIVDELKRLLDRKEWERLDAQLSEHAPEKVERFREARAAMLASLDEQIEHLEDAIEGRLAQEALDEPGDNIPWEQVKQKLGLAG